MNVLVVGSVALDTVETPHGRQVETLGGSASYFAVSCSHFNPVRLVGVVGEDFPDSCRQQLEREGIDLAGLQVSRGKTFRWGGAYRHDMNEAVTDFTHLNVFEEFHPLLPEAYRDSDCVFLANIDPELQLEVLEQVKRPRLVAGDTMNLWLELKPDLVREVASRLDIFILNDAEARMLSGEANLVRAAESILSLGTGCVVIKKGEHGALLLAPEDRFALPGLLLERVVDPTGAGDSFAGGFLGYLAAEGNFSSPALRKAVVYGSVMASFNVESFSLKRLREITPGDIRARFESFKKLTVF